MPITIASVTFFVGLSLIVVAIFGGGLEVKEVKIPTLSPVPRVISFIAGAGLVALCLLFPNFFPQQLDRPDVMRLDKARDTTGSVRLPAASVSGTESKKEPPFLGAAIKNQMITVRDVKIILRNRGLYVGAIDDEAGPSYFQAVAQFQLSQNIDADGYVGPATYAKLRKAWPEFFATTMPPVPARPQTTEAAR